MKRLGSFGWKDPAVIDAIWPLVFAMSEMYMSPLTVLIFGLRVYLSKIFAWLWLEQQRKRDASLSELKLRDLMGWPSKGTKYFRGRKRAFI